jgi:hypothetical protein
MSDALDQNFNSCLVIFVLSEWNIPSLNLRPKDFPGDGYRQCLSAASAMLIDSALILPAPYEFQVSTKHCAAARASTLLERIGIFTL